jgi:hypothetical protein
MRVCPDCAGRCEADWTFEGGKPVAQTGPYECLDCGWIEKDNEVLEWLGEGGDGLSDSAQAGGEAEEA